MTKKTLEQKTKEINWKEWIPVYGICESIQQASKDRKTNSLKVIGHLMYQTVSTSYLFLGLYKLTERLF